MVTMFDKLVKAQQERDNPGVLTPQDQARQAQQGGGGWTPPPGYLQGNTSNVDPLQRTVLNRIGQATGTYLPDNAAGGSAANPNSIFTAKELRKAETAKTYAETNLINEKTSESKTDFANQIQDRLEKRAIETGLRDAATAGGYTGAIEFLKTVDPKQALDFEKAKVELDKNIMENDTYKMAHANDKLKVMAEGYGVLGKMGMAILQAKPEDRQAMYQQILPMVRQVNPNASGTLDANAIGMFGLAAFQATDANKIAAGPIEAAKANTQISKLYARASQLEKQGATIDNNDELKTTYEAIEGEKAKAQQYMDQSKLTKWNLQNTAAKEEKNEQQAEAKEYQLIHSVQGDYDREVKPYTTLSTSIMQLEASLNVLSKDPSNSAAQLNLAYAAAKVFGDSRVSNVDLDVQTSTDSNLRQTYKNFKNWTSSTEKEVLTPNEIGNLKTVVESLKQGTQTKIRNDNHHYMELTKKLGIDIKYANPAPPEAVDILKSNPSPERIKQFEETFGYVPNLGDDQ